MTNGKVMTASTEMWALRLSTSRVNFSTSRFSTSSSTSGYCWLGWRLPPSVAGPRRLACALRAFVPLRRCRVVRALLARLLLPFLGHRLGLSLFHSQTLRRLASERRSSERPLDPNECEEKGAKVRRAPSLRRAWKYLCGR